ncbi:MAG: phenylalanine--tRNA ligase subunit alpha [Patescibacteria group bacterium]|nr:phenylalanine--tRNA ligase subunit alpha [bacterium]MDZ4240817.1 phenylalanine--tRNA ligase subunit alpha [Patescibacteria group bacterium]
MEPGKGHLHPISILIEESNAIFNELGFAVATGPEIETERYNFDALNIPAHHPSRDMWDTFWLKPLEDRKLLRTHTSPVQIRYMETHTPPLRIISPGKVFRHEATDATHESQFYQLEGLMIDRNVSLAHLKAILEAYFRKILSKDIIIRFRPSYFPFVEPGVEIDIEFQGKWLEVMGAGMVHPHALQAAGIHPGQWSGFAFGGGLDRLAMLKYGIPDVRLLYNGDMRLINQF